MTQLLTLCLAFWALFNIGQSVSTKLEFDEEKRTSGPACNSACNSSKEDEDVEVKHTIVVSTKLKSNSRRGLLNNNALLKNTLQEAEAGDSIAQTFTVGQALNTKNEESDEVPIIKGYKSVDSTLIRSPDTREKPPIFTNPIFNSRNFPDVYNTYPVANNPSQWKPSTFYNNVNWWHDESAGNFNDFNRRRDWPSYSQQEKLHRKITDDGVKEFYCRKCRELSGGSETGGCAQQRSSWLYENTTPKIKIDGKLFKLN